MYSLYLCLVYLRKLLEAYSSDLFLLPYFYYGRMLTHTKTEMFHPTGFERLGCYMQNILCDTRCGMLSKLCKRDSNRRHCHKDPQARHQSNIVSILLCTRIDCLGWILWIHHLGLHANKNLSLAVCEQKMRCLISTFVIR